MPRPQPSTESTFHDPLQGGQRGTRDTSFFFPQTVVREFQIVRAGATAEVGDTNAGFINVVTKEGSNKLHGEAFYIGRPSPLSSADTFGHSLDNAQNEFGGSIGGADQEEQDLLLRRRGAGLPQHSLLDGVRAAGSGHRDSVGR